MSSKVTGTSASTVAAVRRNSASRSARRIRQIAATTTALTFMLQNFAWATCSNGTQFPSGGFTPAVATNWSPNIFTGTLGSAWVPDISVNEHNNTKEPLTLGGHNWAFDQGSTTCKETDTGPGNLPATGWAIPPNNPQDCVTLPVVKVQTLTIQTNLQTGQVTRNTSTGTTCGIPAGQPNPSTTVSGSIQTVITCTEVFANFGDIPQRSSVLTPTCDPTLLAPNLNNTYLNQLGCALVLLNNGRLPAQANTPQTATTYVFTAGIKSGLFSYALSNVTAPTAGGEAGKVVNSLTFYPNGPGGQKLDSAVITSDGQYLLGGSSRNNDNIFACRNPLGDPGDLTKPINLTAFATSADPFSVQCMQIGQGGDSRVKGLAIGADGQPYIGGLNVMSNFTNFPACIAGTGLTIAQSFPNHPNNCGKATPNKFLNQDPLGAALKAETQALVSHGQYLYRAIKGGAVYQAKVTATGVVQPVRQFAGKLTSPTGIGFDEGTLPSPLTSATPFPSIVLYDDQSLLGLAAREALYKLPICEDMP